MSNKRSCEPSTRLLFYRDWKICLCIWAPYC